MINSRYSDPDRNRVLLQAVSDMLGKGAIVPVQLYNSPGFYSRLFLVPKKTGDWRPVVDLSALNRFVRCPTFQMDTPELVRASLQQGMWTTSIDLKDAYFHVPIHPSYQKFLRFQVLGRVYQFVALPFGLNTAPRLFTKLSTQVKRMAVCRGIRVHQYIDDWLNRASSRELVARTTQQLLSLIEELGWIVNREKSELVPSQVFEFLSYRYNLVVGKVFPTEKRFQNILLAIEPLLADPHTTPRGLMRIIGLLESTYRLVPLGRLRLRPFQQILALSWDFRFPLDNQIALPPEALGHFRWWTIRDNVMEGVPLHPPVRSSMFTPMLPWRAGAHIAPLSQLTGLGPCQSVHST